jgi:hypothetical protein
VVVLVDMGVLALDCGEDTGGEDTGGEDTRGEDIGGAAEPARVPGLPPADPQAAARRTATQAATALTRNSNRRRGPALGVAGRDGFMVPTTWTDPCAHSRPELPSRRGL